MPEDGGEKYAVKGEDCDLTEGELLAKYNQPVKVIPQSGLWFNLRHPIQAMKNRMKNRIKYLMDLLHIKKRVPLKERWKKLPLKVKVIVIMAVAALLLIVVIICAISDLASRIGVSTRYSGVKSLNITSESSEASQLALELYDKYDSLIGFTTDQLEVIYNNFLSDTSNANKYLLSSGSKKFGSQTGEKYTINQDLTLYQHIQRTEKYNFNKILWREFSHSADNVAMSTELDEELELYFPAGIDQNTRSTLLKMTAPYLLCQDIPLGILTGMVGSSGGVSSKEATTAEKFTYQIIKEALSKITVNKYTLQSIKLKAEHEKYRNNTYDVTYKINTYSNGYQEYVEMSQPTLRNGVEGEEVVTSEVKVDGSEVYNYEIFWYVKDAMAFDREINNTFNHTKYSDQDVNNLVYPDANNLVETITIDEIVGTTTAMQSINKEGGIPTDENGVKESPTETTGPHTYTYVKKQGEKFIYEKEWKDKLSAVRSDNKPLSYDTALKYNTKTEDVYTNMDTDKTIIGESTFKKDNPQGKSIFDNYTNEDKSVELYGMNFIDLLNSNSGIYSKYLNKKANSSTYVGISRLKLKESYTQIKNILNTIFDRKEEDGKLVIKFNSYTSGTPKDQALPFVYGSSLGFKNKSSASNNRDAFMTGNSLLKEYLRSLEGIGDSRSPASTTIVNKDEKEYYVVADSYTVGYGIDLSQNPGWKSQLEGIIGQTIVPGTEIEVELIDKLEDEAIQTRIDAVKGLGIDLKTYQLHALVVRAYNYNYENFGQNYNLYYNASTDDKYEEVYEKYKEIPEQVSTITAEADFNSQLYINYMSKPTSAVGISDPNVLKWRRDSEWVLFSLGYYDRIKKFYREGGATFGNIEVFLADGSVDVEGCNSLQQALEAEIFGGTMSAGNVTMEKTYGGIGGSNATGNTGAVTTVKNSDAQNRLQDAYKPFFSTDNYYQCPWWSRGRANIYLSTLNPDKVTGEVIPDGLGNGNNLASGIASKFNVSLYTDISQITANCIISIDTGNEWGHTAYVEAANERYIIISHCGSGVAWHGVSIIDKQNPSMNIIGYVSIDEIAQKQGII